MNMEDNILTKEDFNLTKEYELFDVIYSVSKNFNENEIKSWVVMGYVLNSSSGSRCFEYELCTYPISVYVTRNEKPLLSNFRNHFISKNRDEIVELKKSLLTEQFKEQLNKL
jgi:hypothetical protein